MPARKTAIQLTEIENEIVSHIRTHQAVTRNEIAEHLNISRSKSTQHIDDLLEAGILIASKEGKSSGGRKPKMIDLNNDFCYIVGIYMGNTGASVGIADFNGKILYQHRHLFAFKNKPREILDELNEQIVSLLNDNQIPISRIYAVGVAIPAPIDKESGLIVSPANLPSWSNFSVTDYFSHCYPNAVIQVDNDANAMALGEAFEGLGRTHDNLLFVKVGTGIGCGIIIDRKLYRGFNGTAGDIGHVSVDRNGPVCYCGNIGCLEKLAAAPAMIEKAEHYISTSQSDLLKTLQKRNKGKLSAYEIGTAASEGDKIANQIIIESGQTIGRVLSTLIGFFNPSMVIIGGGISDIGPQFVTTVHRTILEYSQPLTTQNLDVRKSELGRTAGVYGMLKLATDELFVTD